jgi:hypothetical protein
MHLKKLLTLVILVVAAPATATYAQLYWGNVSPAGIADDIWSVAYGAGVFAAVTNQGNLLTSGDGLTWQTQSIAPGTWLTSITCAQFYDPNTKVYSTKWVAVGDKGTILTSADLKAWVVVNSTTANRLNGVYSSGTLGYDYGLIVAVGENGTIVTSVDAKTWTNQASNFSGFLHGLTTIYTDTIVSGQDGVLLTVDDKNPIPLISTDGPGPDLEAISFSVENPGVPARNGTLVGVGADGTILSGSALFSQLSPSLKSVGPLQRRNVGNYTGTFRALTTGNGYFVAAGEQGMIVTSPDGTTWTQRFSGASPSELTSSSLLSAVYSDTLQRFVITGTGGTILVSSPPPTVFANVSTRGYVSSTQTLIGGFVIEGAFPRTVLIRADGPILSTFGVANSLPDPVLNVFPSGGGGPTASNTGWNTNIDPTSVSLAAQQVGAFPLPASSADSAILVTLPPGAYTVQVTSAKGNSGTALFEAYIY